MIWKSALTLACGFSALLACGWAMAADEPGQHFSFPPDHLAKPHATPAVDNSSQKISRPAGAMPKAPPGFSVSVFAPHVPGARFMAVAPNGDVFVAESDAGKVVVLRPSHDGTKAQRIVTFASGLAQPHGIAFHDGAIYIADTKALWRLPYKDGALTA